MSEPVKEQANQSHFCPQCHNQVLAGTSVCPACKQQLCQVCGSAISRNSSRCPVCGVELNFLCPGCKTVVNSRDLTCPKCGMRLDSEALPLSEILIPAEVTAPPTQTVQKIPSCDVCGRQDETLRYVSYPYVVSFLVVTFRRAFIGLWCRRHRTRYLILSSLITSIAGWFGIPFGFIFTPFALFKLAKGGGQSVDQNLELLRTLADHKLAKGDAEAAIRCLEEALRLRDDDGDRQKLQQLYRRRLLNYQPPRHPVWPLLVVIPAAAAMGIAIGIADYSILSLLTKYFGDSTDIFLVLLYWVQWVAMLFIGGLFFIRLIEWAIHRSGCRQMALAVTVSIISALAVLYGTLQGGVLIGLLESLLLGDVALGGGLWLALRIWLILSSGGFFELIGQVTSGGTSSVIYTVIFVVFSVYYIWIGIRSGSATVKWQRILAEVQPSRNQSSLESRERSFKGGWLVIVAVIVLMALSIVSVPLWGLSYSIQDMSRAVNLIEQGKIDQSVSELEVLIQENPENAMLRIYLATAYMSRGEFGKARDELRTAVELDDSLGMSHAMLALVYYQMGETDGTLQELRKAEEFGVNDTSTQILMGDVSYLSRDFETAQEKYERGIELDPRAGNYFLRLASVHLAQDNPNSALQACEQAASLDVEDSEIQLCYSDVYIYLQNYDQTSQACLKAAEIDPENSLAHSCLSWSSYLQGDIPGALREGEQALQLNRYDSGALIGTAFAYLAQNKLDLAIAASKEAIRLDPKNDLSHYILGLCYSKQGDRDGAEKEFEQFLDLYWDHPYARQWKIEAEAFLAEQ